VPSARRCSIRARYAIIENPASGAQHASDEADDTRQERVRRTSANVTDDLLQGALAAPSIDAAKPAMTTITKVKMVFVGVGLALFAVGIRLDDARFRYAGIACVAIAWVLRFARTRAPTRE